MSKIKRSEKFVKVGTIPVETVSCNEWSHIGMCQEQFEQLWQVRGPSFEKNFDRLPFWKVVCCVYLEGLQHGYGMRNK